jgi:hypothetical protein
MKNNASPFQLWWKMPGAGIDKIWTLDADV